MEALLKAARIPVTILTGFLGSGKSTLVNRVLRELPSYRFGLVVNEFGDAALESQLIETRSQPLIELPAGCLCCVSDGDLEGALKKLLQKDSRVNHILVEASGLSSPGPLIALLTADRPAHEFPFVLGGVFCVVDVSTFLEWEVQWSAVKKQLAFADAIFLAKADLCGAETETAVRDRLAKRYPRLPVYNTKGSLLWNLLFTAEQPSHATSQDPRSGETEDERSFPSAGRRFFKTDTFHGAQVFEYSSDKALVPEALRNVLTALYPAIVRAKGIVYLKDASAKHFKYLLQYTGAQKQLYSRRWSKQEQRRTNLVFLGSKFDAVALQESLDCCRV